MCLLLDMGLRCGEARRLAVGDFYLSSGWLIFYRPKVDKWQKHKMTPDTWGAALAYLEQDGPAEGMIWRISHKGGGNLDRQGWSERGITKRVNYLGLQLGISGLSAHDCRHSWATRAAAHTPAKVLQTAGGWASAAMVLRYISESAVANEGVILE
jgi:integrase